MTKLGARQTGRSRAMHREVILFERRAMKLTTMALVPILALALSASAQQLAELTAPDPSAGTSILLVSQGAALGAPQANEATGAVYLYKVPQGGWQNMGKPSAALLAPDGAPGDEFGASMVTAGNQLLIGAPGHNGGMGTVYVYVNLVLTAELTLDDHELACGFGAALSSSLSDSGKVFVASPGCDYATLYQWDGSAWQVNQQMVQDGAVTAVAIGYGEKLGWLMLATTVAGNGGGRRAAVVVTSGNIHGTTDDFGTAISMQQSSNLLFVGEPSTATVYVYYGPNRAGRPDFGAGNLVAKLTDSSLGPNSGFGSSISARGKQLLIGAPGADVVDLFVQQPKMWASSDTPAMQWSGVGGGTVAWYVGKSPSFIAGEPGAGMGFVVGR
jgi:hypothetical protein